MKSISILGIYVADLVFFADKIPQKGETVLGHEHVIGPGGKGSNQAVAAAKAGGSVNFISKIVMMMALHFRAHRNAFSTYKEQVNIFKNKTKLIKKKSNIFFMTDIYYLKFS